MDARTIYERKSRRTTKIMSSSIIKFISTTTKILLDINEKKNKDEQDLETEM